MLKRSENILIELERELLHDIEKAAEWAGMPVQRLMTITNWAPVLTHAIPNWLDVSRDNHTYGYSIKLPFLENFRQFPVIMDRNLTPLSLKSDVLKIIHQAAIYKLYLPSQIISLAINKEDFSPEYIEQLVRSVYRSIALNGKSLLYSLYPECPAPLPLSTRYLTKTEKPLPEPLPEEGLAAFAAGCIAKMLFEEEKIPEEERKLLVIGLHSNSLDLIKLAEQNKWKIVGINYQRAYYINNEGFDLEMLLKDKSTIQYLSKLPNTKVTNPSEFFSTETCIVIGLERRPLILEGTLEKLNCRYLFCAFKKPLHKEEIKNLDRKGIIAFPEILFPSDSLLYFHLNCIEENYGINFSMEDYRDYLEEIILQSTRDIWKKSRNEKIDLFKLCYFIAWERLKFI